MTQPYGVPHASKLFQDWLTTLKGRAMLQTHNQSKAMLRSVLHNVRRHMTTEQVMTFADALPPLPRGIFIGGLAANRSATHRLSERLSARSYAGLVAASCPPDSIVADVFAVLAEHSEPRAARTMKKQLPEQLRPLWPRACINRRIGPEGPFRLLNDLDYCS
jgi:uncharacterized protein (DUF2267 family)